MYVGLGLRVEQGNFDSDCMDLFGNRTFDSHSVCNIEVLQKLRQLVQEGQAQLTVKVKLNMRIVKEVINLETSGKFP